MLTVKEIMRTEYLSTTKIVAGGGGLNRLIKYVTVMEVPDITQWLRGGEFLITSFYAIKDDINEQCKLIYKLKNANAGALAIKTDRYINMIPEEVIEIANEINFPIIEIPKDLKYTDIIIGINKLVYQSEQKNLIIEDYIKNIINSCEINYAAISAKGKEIGFCIDDKYIISLHIVIDNMDKLIMEKDYNNEKILLLKDRYYYFLNRLIDDSIIVRNNGGFLLFIKTNNKERQMKKMDSVRKTIESETRYNFKELNIAVGCSNRILGLEGIKKGFEEANFALQIGKIIDKNSNWYYYSDWEIYKLFYQSNTNDIWDYVISILSNIIDNDIFMETLWVYFKFNENQSIVSNELYIHINTLKYRLKRIQELTNLDLKNINQKFKLYLAIIGYKIYPML